MFDKRDRTYGTNGTSGTSGTRIPETHAWHDSFYNVQPWRNASLILMLLAGLVLALLRSLPGDPTRPVHQEIDRYSLQTLFVGKGMDIHNHDLVYTPNLGRLMVRVEEVQEMANGRGWLYRADLLDRLDYQEDSYNDLFESEQVIHTPRAHEGEIYLYQFSHFVQGARVDTQTKTLRQVTDYAFMHPGQSYLVSVRPCEWVPPYDDLSPDNTFQISGRILLSVTGESQEHEQEPAVLPLPQDRDWQSIESVYQALDDLVTDLTFYQLPEDQELRLSSEVWTDYDYFLPEHQIDDYQEWALTCLDS